MRRRAALGFTLLELLIAMGVLSFLGTAVVVVLRGGIKTWRRGEARRESFELAQAVLGQIADDLMCATIDPETTGRDGHEVEVVFMGEDRDANDRCRLVLTRTIRGESENALTGGAGSEIGEEERIKYNGDLKNSKAGNLRATGGLMEVAYCMGKPGTQDGEVLYRGIRTPIGGRTAYYQSLPRKPFTLAPLPGIASAAKAKTEGLPLCRAFASRVIHFELLYATPYTTTWDTSVLPRRVTGKNAESGPLNHWDSTRGFLTDNTDPRNFFTFLDATSLANPQDDILPSRVKVTLVLRESDWADSSTYLQRDLAQGATELYVTEPQRLPVENGGGFLYLSEKQFLSQDKFGKSTGVGDAYTNGEWIQYGEVSGNRVQIVKRGARQTKPLPHPAFCEASIGRTFETVIALPAGREDWGGK